jgi:hypothetical protein
MTPLQDSVLRKLDEQISRVQAVHRRLDREEARADSFRATASSMATSADRLARSLDRSVAREYAAFRADESEGEAWRRGQMRRHADRCVDHQRRYDEVFEALGRRAPPPEADAFPPDFRRDLFRLGQSYLPSDHELVQIGDPRDLDGSAIIPFEKQLLAALREQAESPTGDNLPESPNDPKAKREVFDDSLGRKVTTYKARKSFIHDFVRPALRVVRLVDPKKGIVIWGQPFDRVPGR